MFGRTQSFRPGIFARLLLSKDWKLSLSPAKPDRLHLQTPLAVDLQCLDIVAVASTKGLLWHSVEIRSKGRADTLSGLTGTTAEQIVGVVLSFINDHLATLISSDRVSLIEVDRRIAGMTQGNQQYLSQSDISKVISGAAGSAALALAHPLFDASRMNASVRSILPDSFGILTKPDVRRQYNENFVSQELQKFRGFFDQIGGRSLSDEQREACIRLEDNNILIASAGSGKSATLVGKVAYVLSKALYLQDEILVLAYNKSAADELKERISLQLGVDPDALQCRVTTFHALGRRIIEEVRGAPPQLANWVEHPAGEARVIEDIILEQMELDRDFSGTWLDLLSVFPKADIPEQAFDSEADYTRYIADRADNTNVTVGTLAGTFVRSLQEQRIVNWLWVHSVPFEYERQVRIEEDGGTHRFVAPDFYYPATDTIHEHFAINADGSSPFPDYVVHAENKRAGYRAGEMDFFETTSAQSYDGTLVDELERQLKARDIPLVHKSPEEIMKALSPVVIKHYHKLIAVCIKHIRASHLTLEMLLERANSLHDKKRAQLFAKTIWTITEAYSRKLDEAGRIDFDSMIADAVTLVETGQYKSPYSLVLVDEFQDISDPRAKLVKALKQQSAFAKLFVVGDDWQSIYRFAGSDITIFTQFEEHFGASWKGRLQQTYRCNQLLADTAARFIQRNPAQLKKEVRSTRPAIARSIRVIPMDLDRGKPGFGEACHLILDRLDQFLERISSQWRTESGQKLKVLVLWRYNLLDPFRGGRRTYANIEVTGLSFHRSKGLEADYTVLLDVSEGDYGVPSRIEEDELLNLVIPRPETFAYAEERRLFYVALTRASRGVYLLTNRRKPSRYIHELCEIAGADIRFEAINGDELSRCPRCLVGQLVERAGRDGAPFLGCNQFPDCRHTGSLNPARSTVRSSISSIRGPASVQPPVPPVADASASDEVIAWASEKRSFGTAVDRSTSWQGLRAALQKDNLDIAPKGGGIALVRADSKNYICKASEAGFGYPSLIKKFGEGLPGHAHGWLADRILDQNSAPGDS